MSEFIWKNYSAAAEFSVLDRFVGSTTQLPSLLSLQTLSGFVNLLITKKDMMMLFSDKTQKDVKWTQPLSLYGNFLSLRMIFAFMTIYYGNLLFLRMSFALMTI